ncbi:hypothetical protein MML48_2g00019282 [Holotrichia oblita]|uniref:Uncharacterized protein n=1 Tax=Holotrichia oblita TaxID=644536 RepID=A0ACB9TJ36_HOLOL|nr:hypothetical protein MML48_2g00019282 [Holotrichia oblita]
MSKGLSSQHWEILIEFMDEHPNLLKGEFNGPNGKHERKLLWEELTGKLNGVGAGQKSVIKWQKTWADIKYHMKKKASALKGDKDTVEADIYEASKLNSYEKRLLELYGATFFQGVGIEEFKVVSVSDIANKRKLKIEPEAGPSRKPVSDLKL